MILDLFSSFLLLLVITPASTKEGDADTITKEHAVKALQGAVESIRTFDVRVYVETRILFHTDLVSPKRFDEKGNFQPPVMKSRKLSPSETPTSRKENFRQQWRSGSGRFSFFDPSTGQEIKQVVSDGETERVLKGLTNTAMVRRPEVMVVMEGGDYREAYRAWYGRVDLLKSLAQRSQIELGRGGPDKNHVVMTAQPEQGQQVDLPSMGFRVFLDPQHGMLPAVIERFRVPDGKEFVDRRLKVLEWHTPEAGVWVPVRCITQIFMNDPSNKELHGSVGNEIEMRVDVARSSWNKQIPADAFTLGIPAGTKVTDTEKGVQFVTGQADPGRNLEDLAKNARDLVPITMPRPPPVPATPWLLYGSIGAAILCLAAVVVVVLWRRRARPAA